MFVTVVGHGRALPEGGVVMRRHGMREFGRDKLKTLVDEVVESLRGLSRDKQPSTARISLWNSVFKDCCLGLETDVGQHFVDILRRHLVRCTDAPRFCFELAVFMVDLPALFHRIASLFPAPYTVALHIAFRMIHESIEPPKPECLGLFVDKVLEEVPKDQVVFILQALKAMQSDALNIDRTVGRIPSMVSPLCFDLLLQAMPSHFRLHFALKYGRPLPQVQLDFDQLELPFEFLQAIADIEGSDFVEQMIPFEE